MKLMENKETRTEESVKSIYRVVNNWNVEEITTPTDLDELVLCDLPELKHIDFKHYIEEVTITNCPKLQLKSIPSNKVKISNCPAITKFHIDNEDCEISNCDNLEEINVDSSNNDFSHTYVTVTNCKKLSKMKCEGDEEIYLDLIGCDSINELNNASDKFPNLNITPNNITVLRTEVCSNFSTSGFYHLKQLYIGDSSIFDIVNRNDDPTFFEKMIIDDIEMSINCRDFTELEVVRIANGANLYDVDFCGCEKLSDLYIGADSHCDYSLNLSGCPIHKIDLPWGPYELTLDYCKELTAIDIPDIYGFTCEDCTSLETVDLSDEISYISGNAFRNCRSLRSIVIPETVEGIGAHAFEGCTTLERVTCVNPYVEIGEKAFAGCTNLKSVEGLDIRCYLANDAFEGCEQLPPLFYINAAIVGSRTFTDYEAMRKFIEDTCKQKHMCITKIVSGGARGADSYAAKYAKESGIPLIEFIPDWKNNEKKAGLLRNIDIVNNSDLCFAFWDGESRGTMFTLKEAREQDKPCYIYDMPRPQQSIKPF